MFLPSFFFTLHFYPNFSKTKAPFAPISKSVTGIRNKIFKKWQIACEKTKLPCLFSSASYQSASFYLSIVSLSLSPSVVAAGGLRRPAVAGDTVPGARGSIGCAHARDSPLRARCCACLSAHGARRVQHPRADVPRTEVWRWPRHTGPTR